MFFIMKIYELIYLCNVSFDEKYRRFGSVFATKSDNLDLLKAIND